MYRVVISILAVAFAFAGFRNLPRTSDPQAAAAGLVLGGLVVLAFVGGRRSVKAEAVATAVASARAEAAAAAHSNAQALSQVNISLGAREAAVAEFGEQPEWIGPADTRAITAEQFEGSDGFESVLEEMRHNSGEVVEQE